MLTNSTFLKDLVIHATAEELAGMDEVVRGMHTRSGLLAAALGRCCGRGRGAVSGWRCRDRIHSAR